MARTTRWSRWSRWGLGALGVAFGYVAYLYLTIPDVRGLASRDPDTTAYIELRRDEAHDAGRSFTLRRRWVPYNRISNQLKRAVIVTEDSAFFEHEGLDYQQIRESVENSLEDGGAMRGASTITQQLAAAPAGENGQSVVGHEVLASTRTFWAICNWTLSVSSLVTEP